jgi:hypothetical protein
MACARGRDPGSAAGLPARRIIARADKETAGGVRMIVKRRMERQSRLALCMIMFFSGRLTAMAAGET